MARQVVRLIKLEDRVTRLDNGGSDNIPDTDSNSEEAISLHIKED
jgi:hypothetical protein